MAKLKKLMAVIGVLCAVFLLSLVPAYADDDVNESELVPFISQHGAEVRFLQLEKVIDRNVVFAEKIIPYLNETDAENAENLTLELEALKGEVSSVNTSLNSTELVEIYVALKEEAVKISTELRILADTLTEEEKDEIREDARAEVQEKMEGYANRIQQKKQQYYTERVEHVFQKMNYNNSELLQRVREGQVNYGQIRSAVAQGLKNLSLEERKEIQEDIREAKVRQNILRKNADDNLDQLRDNIQKRIREHIDEQDFNGTREQLRERIREHRDELNEKMRERIHEKINSPYGADRELDDEDSDDDSSIGSGMNQSEGGNDP